ncbi:unnamed protein product [Sphagnum balticum]
MERENGTKGEEKEANYLESLLRLQIQSLEQKNEELTEENAELRKLNAFYLQKIGLVEEEIASLKSIFLIKLMNESAKLGQFLSVRFNDGSPDGINLVVRNGTLPALEEGKREKEGNFAFAKTEAGFANGIKCRGKTEDRPKSRHSNQVQGPAGDR